MLTAQPSGGSAPYQYQWQKDGVDIPGANNAALKVNPTATTTYSVRVTATNACAATASKVVWVVDLRCGPKNNKVVVCHSGQSTCVEVKSVSDHLAHGDMLGKCTSSAARQGVEESASPSVSLSSFPNPFTDGLTVEVSGMRADRIRIQFNLTDQQGRIVFQREVLVEESTHTVYLQTGSIPSGLYLLQATAGQKRQWIKVIKL
jgi:hypothetical protein